MKIALVGAGAFGVKHLDALRAIEGVDVVALVDQRRAAANEVAKKYGIAKTFTDLDDVIKLDSVDAVILCTPTPLHAQQTIQCLQAGKHVQVEIPLADSWSDAQAVVEAQLATGMICMVGHTRRFNPSHRWIHQRVKRGKLRIQQMDVQTHFFRRENLSANGQPRSWTDHLLWHHAAHTVDLFQYQTRETIVAVHALQGPTHSELGIAMDMSVQLQSASGAICTLSLSFNNDGPLGTTFRYICDNGTYVARYDDLVDGYDRAIDLSGASTVANGIEAQDREFIAAIRGRREPNASVHQVLACYKVLSDIEQQLGATNKARSY